MTLYDLYLEIEAPAYVQMATDIDVIEASSRNFLMLDVSFTAHMPDCLKIRWLL